MDRFLTPIRGRLAVLLLHDTNAKMSLNRFLLACAASQHTSTTILDTDAFYCANLTHFQDSGCRAELLLLPQQDFDPASLLPLVSSKREFLIIDDLNSLYSLSTDRKRRHQLMILMRLLSHNARENGTWAIVTAYRAEPLTKTRPSDPRSLTALGDVLVEVEIHDGSLKLSNESKVAGPSVEVDV